MIVSSREDFQKAMIEHQTVLRGHENGLAYISELTGDILCYHSVTDAERELVGATSEEINWKP